MNIGLLTSGGDCPGLNAAIRAIVRRGFDCGHQVTGIKNGWLGILESLVVPMDLRMVSGILRMGGTVLGTSRTNLNKGGLSYTMAVERLQALGLDSLIVIGGDGSLCAALELHKQRFPVVGIPKTIDNDVHGTDFCIGFHSAVSVIMEALDRLHTTATSHHRVMVVEVMGRDKGWLALVGGLAGGADWILLPEMSNSMEEVVGHLEKRRSLGKDFSIIVVSEGVLLPEIQLLEEEKTGAPGQIRFERRNIGHLLANEIEKRTGFETRATVLGHLQRGGTPTLFDRVLGTRFGIAAVDRLLQKKFGVMTALQGNHLADVPLEEVIAKSPRKLDIELYEMARLFY